MEAQLRETGAIPATQSLSIMRIAQTSVLIKSLYLDVSSGRLFPAAFQRPYVWGKSDVLAMLHSIVNGYPLGSIVAWSPAPGVDLSKAGASRIGPVQQDASRRSALLLDGQNRLATLCWLAHRGDAPALEYSQSERATWLDGTELVLRLDTGVFEFVSPEEAKTAFALPVRALFDSREGLRICRENWKGPWKHLSEEQQDHGLGIYDKATQAVSDAKLIFTHLERATVEEAKNAFLHICRTGVPMDQQDFERAVAWAE